MGIFRNFTTPNHPNWLIVESNNMIVAEEAIQIAEKCDSKKVKITVKYYDGNADRFAVVKRIKLAVIFLIIISCKSSMDTWLINYPKETSEAVELFMDYAPSNIKAKRLTILLTGEPIKYADGFAAGLASFKNKTITLDTTSSQWKRARKALILHELGHYVLNRHHNDSRSLMNPWYFPSDEEMNNPVILDYYMQELFNQ